MGMRISASFLAVALLLASGCERPAPPIITPRSAKVTSLSPAGIQLSAELDAENPNGVTISARSVTAKITLDGRYDVGTVRVAAPLEIPAHKTAHLTVPLSLKWADVTSIGLLAAQNRSIPYDVDGTVELGGDTIHFDAPFHMNGS